jgi:hypothetical protein
MISAPIYFYPNRVGRIVLLAMEEILGHNGEMLFLILLIFRIILNSSLLPTRT